MLNLRLLKLLYIMYFNKVLSNLLIPLMKWFREIDDYVGGDQAEGPADDTGKHYASETTESDSSSDDDDDDCTEVNAKFVGIGNKLLLKSSDSAPESSSSNRKLVYLDDDDYMPSEDEDVATIYNREGPGLD